MNLNELCVATLDVETTGLDPVKDRIIELAYSLVDKGVFIRRSVLRFDPGMPIPPEATAVHGITDDDVRNKLTFAEAYSNGLGESLNCIQAVQGYNVSFDLQFLAAEISACGGTWPRPGLIVLDGMKIWSKQKPRTLQNACLSYDIFVDPDQLHQASYDVAITEKLLAEQLAFARLDGLTLADVVAETNGLMIDPAGKIAINESGQPVYTFGKHAGQPVLANRGYANWMLDSDFPASTKNVLRGLLQDPDYIAKLIEVVA